MISRTLEWHRIVDTKPTPDKIDRRKAAIQHLAKALDESPSWDVVLGSVVGVVGGFNASQRHTSAAVTLIYESLRGHDSTIPQDLVDNALELRAGAATALGEILVSNPQSPPSYEAVVIASTLLSGLSLRATPKERYVKAMLDELSHAARETLARAQSHRRRRIALGKSLSAIDEKNIPDPTAAIAALVKATKELGRDFSDQAALDREELNILWWLFGESSSTFGTRIEDLPAGKASFAIGTELGNLCLLPPADSSAAIVKRASRLVKNADTKRPLEKAIQETDKTSWELLTSAEDKDLLGSLYPQLAPMTWLSAKLLHSNVTVGWAPEFSAVTGIDAAAPVNTSSLAEHVFLERVVQRLYQQ